MAFPTIYIGQVRPDNSNRCTHVHYSTICKWELCHVDRRTAMCIPNIFFELKKLQIKQIKDTVSLAVWKCKTQGRKMTACEVLSSDFIDTLVKQDDGFRVLRNLRGNFQKVAKFVSEVNTASTLSFEEFLQEIDMSLETYLHCIQSTLTVSKVFNNFLKRSLEETRIDNYNKTLLKCWEANLDIQFILDPFACVSYKVSYISKGQTGLSNLLSDACQETKRKDSDIRQQVRRIGNQFLSHVEIGA